MSTIRKLKEMGVVNHGNHDVQHGFSNPTASVGPAAVNGTASTFMRSDGAPALANTSVIPGAYTAADITVDAQGRLTTAASGGSFGEDPSSEVGPDPINGTAITFMRSDGAPALAAPMDLGELENGSNHFVVFCDGETGQLFRFNNAGNPLSYYVKFVTGDYHGLSLSTKTDANADSGFTMEPNTFHQVAWIGDAASAIILPPATVGVLTVFRFTGVADGGASITFTTEEDQFFADQTLNTDVTNFGDAQPGSRRVIGTDFAQTVATFGGEIVTVESTHNRLTISATATNNQTNIGAELGFYCESTGFWRLSFKGSELGSGALNATFETSEVVL